MARYVQYAARMRHARVYSTEYKRTTALGQSITLVSAPLTNKTTPIPSYVTTRGSVWQNPLRNRAHVHLSMSQHTSNSVHEFPAIEQVCRVSSGNPNHPRIFFKQDPNHSHCRLQQFFNIHTRDHKVEDLSFDITNQLFQTYKTIIVIQP